MGKPPSTRPKRGWSTILSIFYHFSINFSKYWTLFQKNDWPMIHLPAFSPSFSPFCAQNSMTSRLLVFLTKSRQHTRPFVDRFEVKTCVLDVRNWPRKDDSVFYFNIKYIYRTWQKISMLSDSVFYVVSIYIGTLPLWWRVRRENTTEWSRIVDRLCNIHSS